MTPVPARPCGGCERKPRNQPGAVLRGDATLLSGALPVAFRGVGYISVASSARRRRAKSERSRAASLTRQRVRDWFFGGGGDICRRGVVGSSRVPHIESHRAIASIGLGGTIPSPPPVSTGKPVTPRCQCGVVTTCTLPTSSGDVPARKCGCQGLIPAVSPRKCAGVERAAIRCEYVSSANREGCEKSERRKNADVRKKKMPPPVPCGSSFGNPLIEKGASRVSFGSHYSLDASAEDGLASVIRIKIKAPKQVSVGSPNITRPITYTAEARP
jgi:hypothetical protein